MLPKHNLFTLLLMDSVTSKNSRITISENIIEDKLLLIMNDYADICSLGIPRLLNDTFNGTTLDKHTNHLLMGLVVLVFHLMEGGVTSVIVHGTLVGCSKVIGGLRGGSILCSNLRGVDIVFGGLGDNGAVFYYLDGLNAVGGTFVSCGAICRGPKGDGKVIYNRDNASCIFDKVSTQAVRKNYKVSTRPPATLPLSPRVLKCIFIIRLSMHNSPRPASSWPFLDSAVMAIMVFVMLVNMKRYQRVLLVSV